MGWICQREAQPTGVVHSCGDSWSLHQSLPPPCPPYSPSTWKGHVTCGRERGTNHCQAALGQFSKHTVTGSMPQTQGCFINYWKIILFVTLLSFFSSSIFFLHSPKFSTLLCDSRFTEIQVYNLTYNLMLVISKECQNRLSTDLHQIMRS